MTRHDMRIAAAAQWLGWLSLALFIAAGIFGFIGAFIYACPALAAGLIFAVVSIHLNIEWRTIAIMELIEQKKVS